MLSLANTMTTASHELPDIQSTEDPRRIHIDQVGMRGLTVPLMVQTETGTQATVAKVNMSVALSAQRKGTHMSRFVGLLFENAEPLSAGMLRSLLEKMLALLETDAGRIEVQCPFFVMKAAPVTGVKSLMDYEVRFTVEKKAGVTTLVQEVVVPVTSLCPCSREISNYGAHNQRSRLTMSLTLSAPMTLEEETRIAESAGSCELWSRLKRHDEKYVTEYAYEHPKFVEDIVRDMAQQLNADERVAAYRVTAENFESIHNHSAYAEIIRDKR